MATNEKCKSIRANSIFIWQNKIVFVSGAHENAGRHTVKNLQYLPLTKMLKFFPFALICMVGGKKWGDSPFISS